MSTTSVRALGLASAAPSALAIASGALASFGLAGLAFGAGAGFPILFASAACAALAWKLSRPARREEVYRLTDRLTRASAAAVDAFRSPPPASPEARARFEHDRAALARRLKRTSDSGRTRLAAALHRIAYVVAPSRD